MSNQNQNQAPKKILVKILKNCVPEFPVDAKIYDALGRVPKDSLVELDSRDARNFIKSGVASADAAI
tara:strand:- start:1554 stop:1754 length:201 start_codon:yes stop_codon:yes gene_type:complete